MLEFRCPMCGHDLKSLDQSADRAVRCEHCGEGITIPLFNLSNKPEKPTVPAIPDSMVNQAEAKPKPSVLQKLKRTAGLIRNNAHFHEFWRLARGPVLLILGLIYFGVITEYYTNERRDGEYDFSGEALAVMTHMSVGTFLVGMLLPKSFAKWQRSITYACLIGGGLYVLTCTGFYTIVLNAEQFFFYERRYRATDEPFHQEFWFKDTGDRLGGPISSSGTRHGRWIHTSIGHGETSIWYWHDEKVTEAQFFRFDSVAQ